MEGLECVHVILDDMIITGSNDSKHLKNLEANMAKCVFVKDRIEFCAHSVDRNGLHQNTDKVKAITEARRSTYVSEVKRFTGMVNYYHKFLPNIASVLFPWHELTQKGKKFHWSEGCQKAFDKAKQLVASNKLLVNFK